MESIESAFLSHDLGRLIVFGKREAQSIVAWMDTSVLAARKEEIAAIANESFHVSMLLQQLRVFGTKMVEEWRAISDSVLSKQDSYQKLLHGELLKGNGHSYSYEIADGSKSSLQADLVMLLSVGKTSPSLERFFCGDLKSSVCCSR